jgi:hypothetical protein
MSVFGMGKTFNVDHLDVVRQGHRVEYPSLRHPQNSRAGFKYFNILMNILARLHSLIALTTHPAQIFYHFKLPTRRHGTKAEDQSCTRRKCI